MPPLDVDEVVVQSAHVMSAVPGAPGDFEPVHTDEYQPYDQPPGPTSIGARRSWLARSAAALTTATPSGRTHVGPLRSKRATAADVLVATSALNVPLRPAAEACDAHCASNRATPL